MVFLVLLLMVWGMSRVRAKQALTRMQQEQKRLEEYYQAGNYGEMGTYLKEIDGWGSSYRKYSETRRAYERKESVIESAFFCVDFAKRGRLRAGHLSYDLEDHFEELDKIRELEEQDFPYDVEKAMLEFREEYLKSLKETFLLTEEEIEEGMQNYAGSGTDYSELSEKIAERMNEEYEEDR